MKDEEEGRKGGRRGGSGVTEHDRYLIHDNVVLPFLLFFRMTNFNYFFAFLMNKKT